MGASEDYNTLKKMVLNKNKTKQGHTEARQSLENIYSQVYDPNSKDFKSLVNEEVADILAQKLGDQDFVNSLSTEKPTVFKRIYDWVVDKVNKITGNKIEKVYWEDIKNKFENAYRQTYQGENSNQTRYSIQKDSNGNQYVKVDTDQDIFEGIDKKDYNKIAKMYMQDYLKGNTKLGQNDTTNIGRRGINKYTNPQQQTTYFDEKMKLTPELKNALKIAQKVSQGTPSKSTSKFSNWEYYKFKFELSGKQFEGLINIGIDKNGKKHFYEINKIHTTSNSYVSTNKSSSMNLSNNSITPSQNNVNTTNQSMQNSKNDTQNIENTSNKSYNNNRADINEKTTNQGYDRRRVQGLLETNKGKKMKTQIMKNYTELKKEKKSQSEQ